jgi:hypothetical protein
VKARFLGVRNPDGSSGYRIVDINGPRRVDSSNIRRTVRSGGGGAQSFAAGDISDAQKPSGLTGSNPLTAVDTILALQGVDDSSGGRKQGVTQGEHLLDLLDNIRDGLLSGGIPRLTLTRLAMATSKRGAGFSDPKLQTILDEIELRALVELAKLEQNDGAKPLHA